MKIVVADASPLIGLGRVGQLTLLKDLYGSILIPTQVFEELKLSSHKPGAQAVSQAVQDGWIKNVAIHSQSSVKKLCRIVDVGEAEAIQLAIEQHADLLLIDDLKGRKVAKAQGVAIIGIGGVLVAAKKAGFLNAVSPVLNALTSAGYRLAPVLCQRIIELAGE